MKENTILKEANVVMLATGGKSRLSINTAGPLHYSDVELNSSANFTSQHLYFTTDEEIKQDDWCINGNNRVVKYDQSVRDKEVCKKIVATTNPELHTKSTKSKINDTEYETFVGERDIPKIPDTFITKFVEEWNKGNKIEKVRLEYGKYCSTGNPCNGQGRNCDEASIKLNIRKDDSAIVHVFREKTFNKKDLCDAFIAGAKYAHSMYWHEGDRDELERPLYRMSADHKKDNFPKWFDKNYSE
jgi:hypothetical protein